MADIKIRLRSLSKDILITVPDGQDPLKSFNGAVQFVHTLEANGLIRDQEAGIDPPRAMHEIIREKGGEYRLRRFRFNLDAA